MKSPEEAVCWNAMLAVKDALYVLQGKWKMPIILSLTFGNRCFRDLERQVEGITPKMLSKELKHLEENRLISRKVLKTKPIQVEYALTEHGKTLKPVILALQEWGALHRKKIFESDGE